MANQKIAAILWLDLTLLLTLYCIRRGLHCLRLSGKYVQRKQHDVVLAHLKRHSLYLWLCCSAAHPLVHCRPLGACLSTLLFALPLLLLCCSCACLRIVGGRLPKRPFCTFRCGLPRLTLLVFRRWGMVFRQHSRKRDALLAHLQMMGSTSFCFGSSSSSR